MLNSIKVYFVKCVQKYVSLTKVHNKKSCLELFNIECEIIYNFPNFYSCQVYKISQTSKLKKNRSHFVS